MKSIRINPLTYVFIFLIVYSGYVHYLLIFLLVFMIHELGHIFFIKLFNIQIIKIEIYPYGGLIILDKKLNVDIYKDFLIASGGLLFQVIAGLINCFIFRSDMFLFFNKLILYMNIIPLIPLDGSNILFIFLSKYFPYRKSINVYYFLSLCFIIIYFLYGIKTNAINIAYLLFCICSYLTNLKTVKYVLNTFYLERYLYDFSFKHKKYHQKVDINLLKRNEESFFLENTWKNEKEILSKKFDNCSYFW